MFMGKKKKMPTKKQLMKDYDKLRSQTAIAYKYDVSTTTVGNWFKRRGIRSIEQIARCEE